jgi:hypothetical protein
MANEIVPHTGSSVEYYSPSSGRIVEIHHHHHYITVQQPKSDDSALTALKAIGGIVGGIGALLAGVAAINGASHVQPSQQEHVPQQQSYQYQAPTYQAPRYEAARYVPPPRCYLQQRSEYLGKQFVGREYVGREIVYQEKTPYGIHTVYRDIYRNHYQDQYRNYTVRVCE